MVIPPLAEVAGTWTNAIHFSFNWPGAVPATLLVATTTFIFQEMAIRHAGTPMQVSEWIGPGIARGMRKAADFVDT